MSCPFLFPLSASWRLVLCQHNFFLMAVYHHSVSVGAVYLKNCSCFDELLGCQICATTDTCTVNMLIQVYYE